MSRKLYVLDTSVLLYDSNSLRSFGSKEVVIPYVVLEELDRFKTREDLTGKNARQVARELNQLRQKGPLSEGVEVNASGGVLRVQTLKARGPSADDDILATCLILGQEVNTNVILVTKDINLAVRADALTVNAQDFDSDKTVESASDSYTGRAEVTVPDELVDRFYSNEGVLAAELDLDLFANQYVTLTSEVDLAKTALARVEGPNKPLVKLRSKGVWGIKPRNREQQFAIDALLNTEVALVTLTGQAGTGKAQPLDAQVLTPEGYVVMGSLSVGDLVSIPDGSSAKVTGVFPQGLLDIYRVGFSDGSSTECCDDHLWETQTEVDRARGKRGTVKSLKEIRNTLNSREHLGTPRSNHSIPMTLPVIFAEKATPPLDPYCLGLLLGDGSLSHPGCVYFSSADQELVLAMCGIHMDTTLIKCKGENYDYRIIRNSGKINKNSVKSALQELELFGCRSENKFVPSIYKWSSVSNRIAILQGLMDTDGTVGKDGTTVTYTTVSPRLAEDVQFIVESLGGKAVIKTRTTEYTYKGEKKQGKLSYRLFLSFPPSIGPFRLLRKVDRLKPRSKYLPTRYIRTIEKIGKKEAQCIRINSKDRLYLTNNFIVTHNTLIALACSLHLIQDLQVYDRLVVSRPVQPLGKDIGFLPGDIHDKMSPWMGPIKDSLEFLTRGKDKSRDIFSEMVEMNMLQIEPLTYIRGRSLPNTIFLIDEAQDISRPEIKTIVSRMGENSKLILIGDTRQISNPYLDATNSGLSNVVERFKPYRFSAHVDLVKGERSELATVAAEIL